MEKIISETEELIRYIEKNKSQTISNKDIKIGVEKWLQNNYKHLSEMFRRDKNDDSDKALNYLITNYNNRRLKRKSWLKNLKIVLDTVKNKKISTGLNSIKKSRVSNYIDNNRIVELKKIQNNDFDLSRLIKMCEEINNAFPDNCITTIALVRAIIDHVPPIFQCKKFSEVANNYKGAKSFKDLMKQLEESSRNIADAYLHIQIRKKESLPNKTQVNFSQNLDTLLSEIIRILA